ncbi:MAG TPA: hypothetical protein DCQ31_06945, partial [Bacteroidales bacterium]|nr:hypothetical protein [Bacteroidales bacterium]
MKTLYVYVSIAIFMVASLCLPLSALSQSIPKGLSYQAIARTDAGVPISNKSILVEMTVLSDSETGTKVWQEIHTVTTDESGFFSLVVGEGSSTLSGTAASFDAIDWGNKELFLKTRVDFGVKDFGNGMVNMGVIKLLSVPYALLADSALKAPLSKVAMNDITDVDLTGLAVNQVLKWNGTDWVPGNATSGTYVSVDGTTDLTGDWNISSRNITLTNGTITSKTSISNNTITSLFKLQIGVEINEISADATLGGLASSDARLVTQKAIKTYVDNNMPTGGYWTLNNNDVFNTSNNIGIGTNAPLEK